MFLGASAALVLSIFIAVFLGHILKVIVPGERYIRAAAILFIVFGCSIAWEVASSFRAKAAEGEAVAGENVGFVGGIAFSAAMDLERMAGERYRKLAESASPELAAALRELAKEEDSHLLHLREFGSKEREDAVWNPGETPEAAKAGISVRMTPDEQSAPARLIGDEESTALFYRGLAGKALIPSVRSVLMHLADEEEEHAKRLRGFAEA